MIPLGSKVTDKVTGYSGAVTQRAEYLSGAQNRYAVEALSSQGGVTMEWFDEGRLILTTEEK